MQESKIKEIKDPRALIDSLENVQGKKYEFIKTCLNNYLNGISWLVEKGNDYAKNEDPFYNFRFNESLGQPVQVSLLMEVGKKLSRLSNLINKDESDIKFEAIEDNIIDAMNYLNMLATFIMLEKGTQPSTKKVVPVVKPETEKIKSKLTPNDIDDF